MARLENNLNLNPGALLAAIEQAVKAGADVVGDASQRVVPDDPGTGGHDLHDSMKITTKRDGDGATATISYSGRHAIPQHQRTDYRHRPGHQAKYLEQPLHSSGPEVLQAMGRVMKDRLG